MGGSLDSEIVGGYEYVVGGLVVGEEVDGFVSGEHEVGDGGGDVVLFVVKEREVVPSAVMEGNTHLGQGIKGSEGIL